MWRVGFFGPERGEFLKNDDLERERNGDVHGCRKDQLRFEVSR